MGEAIFGLIGTLVGGGITVAVAFINNKAELSLWKEQFGQQSNTERNKLRLEKYASFLGALNYLNGAFGDIEDILSSGDDLKKKLSEAVSDSDLNKAGVTLNNDKGWIVLMCSNENIASKISELEKAHDDLFSTAIKVRDEDCPLNDYSSKHEAFNVLSNEVQALLKEDALV